MSKQPQDERIVAQKRKIASDGFSLLLLVLWLSVPVQQFVFEAPPAQYAFEFICAIVFSYYIVLRNLRVGNNLFPRDTRRLKLTTSLVMAATIAGVNSFLAFRRAGEFSRAASSMLVSFLAAFATSFALISLLYAYNQRRQRQIQRQLDEDEL